MRILLVEDDVELGKIISKILQSASYVVDLAASKKQAIQAINSHDYPLIIVDRMLPDGDGIEVIEYSNKKPLISKFLILSALDQSQDKVSGLNAGADDYLSKPFEPDELLARVRAITRRPTQVGNRQYNLANVMFDVELRQTFIDKNPVTLPRRELLILSSLIQRANQVVLRESLENSVYGFDDIIQSNSLEAQISRLRKNLKNMQAKVQIHTVRGVGYMLRLLDE